MKSIFVIVFCLITTIVDAQSRDYSNHVIITRDEWGVPHIFGDTDKDVAYGFAWAQAEDDFKTIQEAMLSARTMQAMVTGKDGAVMDFLVHFFGSRKIVEAQYEKDISPEFKLYLEAFVAGMNAYAKANPKEVLIKKALPFTVYDLLAGYHLTAALIQNAHEPIKDLLDGKYDTKTSYYGSNAFAVSSKRSLSNNPILCINPHVPFEGFFSWYEAHLVSKEGLNMYGATLIGGCSLFVGTNQNLGWSHTFNKLDQVEVYELKMHETDKLKYEYDGKWLELEKRTAKLKVKVKKWLPRIPVKKTTYWSEHGPVLKSKKGKYYAVRFASLNEIRSIEQWYRMNKAKNLDEFKATLDMNALPKFNIVYADKWDNIYYIGNGKIPLRDATIEWKDMMPGNNSKYVWNEFYPNKTLPKTLNPDCGYVFNCNNSPFSASCELSNSKAGKFASEMGFRVNENNRSLRFIELIELNNKLSFDDVKTIKYDNQLPNHGNFYNSIRWLFEADRTQYPEVENIMALMQNWDRKATFETTGAAPFLVTFDYIFTKKGYNDINFLTGIEVDEALYLEALKHSKKYLLKHFGSIEVQLKDIQVLRRGRHEVPMPGFPDVLAANYSKPAKDGKYVGYVGDSYTLIVEYGADGPKRIESLVAFGSSSKPNSPHYNDQMERFSKQNPKPVTLDRNELFKLAKRVYRPGVSFHSPELKDANIIKE